LPIDTSRQARHEFAPMCFPDLPKKWPLPDLEVAAAGLDGCVRALTSGLPDLRVVDYANLEVRRAARVHLGSRWVFPHAEQEDILLSLMMLIRMASANNGALALISAGYVLEARVLWGMIDATYENIVWMSGPRAAASSDDSRRAIDGPAPPHTLSLVEAVKIQASHLFRSLVAVTLVARGANRTDVVDRAFGLSAELARITGCLDSGPL